MSGPDGRVLEPRLRDYVSDSYPHNHDYRVANGSLRPRWKLSRRWRKLRRLYPQPLTSLLDVGCSKGFFVLQAAATDSCRRSLGIDVYPPNLEAARAVGDHLCRERARFERLYLHELADRIEDFGGPFQTVLLINTYHYLFFGSGFDEQHSGDHDQIFDCLRRVCAERLIFSNRTALAACPRNIQERARRLGLEQSYDDKAIRAAASPFFEIHEQGSLGRIPLWVLRRRS